MLLFIVYSRATCALAGSMICKYKVGILFVDYYQTCMEWTRKNRSGGACVANAAGKNCYNTTLQSQSTAYFCGTITWKVCAILSATVNNGEVSVKKSITVEIYEENE